MSIEITGKGLTIEKVVQVARDGEKVRLHPDALARIEKCRGLLEEKIAAGEIMYGVNTGIGELSEVALSPDQMKDFQRRQEEKAEEFQRIFAEEDPDTPKREKFSKLEDELRHFKKKKSKKAPWEKEKG